MGGQEDRIHRKTLEDVLQLRQTQRCSDDLHDMGELSFACHVSSAEDFILLSHATITPFILDEKQRMRWLCRSVKEASERFTADKKAGVPPSDLDQNCYEGGLSCVPLPSL